MTLNHLPKFIYACYMARRVPFLLGPKGIGKSDIANFARQIIGERINDPNFGFIDLRLGTQEEGDLIGMPRTREVKPGVFKTIHTKPEWWPEEGTNGILFLDEFNRGSYGVIQAMFQIVLGTKNHKTGKIERYMHTHKLPDGWSIICAGNPETGDYLVQSIDASMLDRLVQIKVETNPEIASTWMQHNLHNNSLWKFVAEVPMALGDHEPYSLNVTPSPRSYEILDDILKYITTEDFEEFGMELCMGVVGETVGTMLFNFLKKNLVMPLTADEVMNTDDFEKFADEKLATYLHSGEEKDQRRLELLNITLQDIAGYAKDNEYTEKQRENINKFMEFVPADMVLEFLKHGIQYGEKFVPVIYPMIRDEKKDFVIRMIKAMGYTDQEITDGIQQLEKLKQEYLESKIAEEKTSQVNPPILSTD